MQTLPPPPRRHRAPKRPRRIQRLWPWPSRQGFSLLVAAITLAAVVPLVGLATTDLAAAAGEPIVQALAPSSDPVAIPLVVDNRLAVSRQSEPVTTGVPLARGQLTDAGQLWLQDDLTGQAVPAQFTVTSRWNGPPSDTTKFVKWVLVDFQTDVAASGRRTFTLRQGATNPSPVDPVTISTAGTTVTIDTGPAQFDLSTADLGGVIEALRLDNDGDGNHETTVIAPGTSDGIVVERPDGSIYRSRTDSGSAHQLTVETNGPLHTVVKLTGRHNTGTGNGYCVTRYGSCVRDQFDHLDYTIRLHAYAGQPYLRVFYSVTNPERGQQGPANAGGEILSHQWERFGLDLNLVSSGQPINYTFGAEAADNHEFPGDKNSAPGVGPATVNGSLNGSDTVELYQDSSGVDNWGDSDDGLWGTSFQGFRLYDNNNTVASGRQATGWMTASNSNWSMGLGLRHFWQNFPKAMALAGDGSLTVDFWPARFANQHFFRGGRQKTHEMTVGAWPTATPATTVGHTLSGSLDPLHAMAPAEHYSQTQALGFVPVEQQTPDPVFDHAEQSLTAAIEATGDDAWAERFGDDLYGWANWGDAYRNGWKDVRYFGNNEFDLAYVNLAAYLADRDHDRRFFDLAESQARHLYDIDAYHTGEDEIAYSHGIRKHDASGIEDHSQTPLLSHYWIRGTLDYYLLTGDRFALDTAVETGKQLDALIDDQTGELEFHGETRAQAWALLGLIELWETTGETRYLTTARQLAQAEIIAEQSLAGVNHPCPHLDWTGNAGDVDKDDAAVWQNGYVAEALGRYAVASRVNGQVDNEVEEALVRLLDAITECGWATPDNGKFIAGDASRDNVVYSQPYHSLVLDRIQPDGSYEISFALNQLLTDGFAYGYLLTGHDRYLAMADETWIWSMGPETMPGTANPAPIYDRTSSAAKSYGFRNRFGHAYLWLKQYLADGPPPPTTSTTVTTSPSTSAPSTTTPSTTAPPTTASTTTTAPSSTTSSTVTVPGGVCDGFALDFESAADVDDLKGLGTAPTAAPVADNGGQVVELSANNVNHVYLIHPDGRTTASSRVEMSADVKMSYYGSSSWGAVGPASGLVLKTLPDAGAVGGPLPEAYMVSARFEDSGIVLRAGVVADAKAGTADWEFLGSADGHSPAASRTVFPRSVTLDNQSVDLGYHRLRATLRPSGSDVTVEVELQAPDGAVETLNWTDGGANAYLGEGESGITAAGVWSLPVRYDNIVNCDNPTQPPGPGEYSFDFESAGQDTRFVGLAGSPWSPSTVGGNGGRVLSMSANNSSRPLALTDESGSALQGRTVSASGQLHMHYYGSRNYGPLGPPSGFLLKTLPTSSGGVPDGYIVSASVEDDGVGLRIGAIAGSAGGRATYNFMTPTDGHSAPLLETLFPQRLRTNNKAHDLGWWTLEAELTTVGAGVEISAVLTAPDGRTRSATWRDTGSAASTGSGSVGLVNEGVWSLPNQYDNLRFAVS